MKINCVNQKSMRFPFSWSRKFLVRSVSGYSASANGECGGNLSTLAAIHTHFMFVNKNSLEWKLTDGYFPWHGWSEQRKVFFEFSICCCSQCGWFGMQLRGIDAVMVNFENRKYVAWLMENPVTIFTLHALAMKSHSGIHCEKKQDLFRSNLATPGDHIHASR